MITFHEIGRIIQKMAILGGHITQLNALLPEVVQLSEKINSLNEDLTVERDRITAKIRSVEILGEILKTHVYQNQTTADPNLADTGFGRSPGNPINSESSRPAGMADSGFPGATEGGESQSTFYPRLDGSSMKL